MNITPRAYQLSIYNSIVENGSTLVILPTGIGKTLIAIMLIEKKMKEGRCIFLTPTKPLAKQHVRSIKEILGLGDEDLTLVTGEIAAKARLKEYGKKVIVATPQTIRNDLKAGRLNPEFSLCVFDEAHRAVKDYAYTYIANRLPESTLIVGLTASPGGKNERIKEVVNNLRINNIEARTALDKDVKQYVHESFIKWIPVYLSPTLLLIKKELDGLISHHAKMLTNLGFRPPLKHKGQFMKLRERIMGIEHGLKYPALVQYSIILHLLHMLELAETQGLHTLRSYIVKLSEKKTKSAKKLLQSAAFQKIKELVETKEEHPKLKQLIDLVKGLHGKKIIVFAQYRDQIKLIENELNAAGIAARQFVGKKDGFTRKMQEERIVDFREGKFDVLCATSIAEEGLDIPTVDVVIFYEPIPSEIRAIQRRGRAARFKKGEVYILMTKDTRDEYYYWSALKKEKKMKAIIASMQKDFEKEKNEKPKLLRKGQMLLTEF